MLIGAILLILAQFLLICVVGIKFYVLGNKVIDLKFRLDAVDARISSLLHRLKEDDK